MNELSIGAEKQGVSAIQLLTINEDSDFPIDGREFHSAIGAESKYIDWFNRMCSFGFEEGIDYLLVSQKKETNNPRNPWTTVTNHMLTMDMAKHIAMVQRTDKAMEIRQYLIDTEKAWNSPEQVMSRALKIADRTIANLQKDVMKLQEERAIMLPKAEYFDDLVDRKLNTNLRDTAKEFGIKESVLRDFLLDNGYWYRDSKGKLKPYADKNNGMFVLKECKGMYSDWAGTQTLITRRGRETLRFLIKNLRSEREQKRKQNKRR